MVPLDPGPRHSVPPLGYSRLLAFHICLLFPHLAKFLANTMQFNTCKDYASINQHSHQSTRTTGPRGGRGANHDHIYIYLYLYYMLCLFMPLLISFVFTPCIGYTCGLKWTSRSFYVVLCVRNFHRGAPMIPDDQGITINQGSRQGFPTWRRFCDGKFRLADYLPHFLEKICGRQALF